MRPKRSAKPLDVHLVSLPLAHVPGKGVGLARSFGGAE
jgi:hypothetical protein